MRPNKGQIPREFLRMAIFVCLVALYLTSVEFASAKFVSEASAADGATAAQFSPSLIYENNIDILGIKKPGDSTEKTFTVQNFSGDSVSEVTIKYKIVVKTTGNLPLKFSILDGGRNSVAVWPYDGISGEHEYTYETDSLIFSPGVNGPHSYTLKAEWPAEENGAQFAGLTDAVYLSVVWEQVD